MLLFKEKYYFIQKMQIFDFAVSFCIFLAPSRTFYIHALSRDEEFVRRTNRGDSGALGSEKSASSGLLWGCGRLATGTIRDLTKANCETAASDLMMSCFNCWQIANCSNSTFNNLALTTCELFLFIARHCNLQSRQTSIMRNKNQYV